MRLLSLGALALCLGAGADEKPPQKICPLVHSAATPVRSIHRWTDQQILAAIQGAYGRVSLSTKAIMKDDSAETQAVLQQILGVPVTGKSLYHVATRRFKGWKNALVSAGLDPKLIKERLDWTPELVIEALKLQHSSLGPLSVGILRGDQAGDLVPGLKARFGSKITGSRLVAAASTHFESWEEALKAAGLDPNEHRLTGAWTPEQVIGAIQLLHKSEVSVNYNAVALDQTATTRGLLKTILKREANGLALVAAANNHFGGWDKALVAAGLNPEEIRFHVAWTKEKVIRAIQALHKAGIQLNSNVISTDTSEATKKILEVELRRQVSGGSVYNGGIDLFGGWNEALLAAGLDPKAIRRQHQWTREEIIESLRMLYAESPTNLRSDTLRYDNSPEMKARLKPILKTDLLGGAALHNAAVKEFGTMEAAIREAGGDPNEVRVALPKIERVKLIRFLHLLRRENLPIGAANFMSGRNPRVDELVKLAFGSQATPTKIVLAVRNEFGSWRDGLLHSGLNLQDVRILSTWDGRVVAEAIRDLKAHGYSLDAAQLEKNRTPEIRNILERHVGHRASGKELRVMAELLFGTWEIAVETSTETDQTFTREEIDVGVKALAAANFPLDTTHLFREAPENVAATISEALGRTIKIRHFLSYAVRHHGSWRGAVLDNGFEVKKRSFDHRTITSDRDRLISVIKELRRRNISLTSGDVSRMEAGPDAVLTQIFGRPLSGSMVVYVAIDAYGSWENALRAADINPAEVLNQWRWKKVDVLSAILVLHRDGHLLQEKIISVDHSGKLRETLARALHRTETGTSLHQAAIDYYGSWEEALAAVGLYADGTAPSGNLAKEKTNEALRALHSIGIPLGEIDLVREVSPEAQEAIRKIFGRKVTPTQLYYQVRRQSKAPWEKVLREANISVDEVRKNVEAKGAYGLSVNAERPGRVARANVSASGILDAMRLLHSVLGDFSPDHLSKDTAATAQQILHDFFGGPLTPAELQQRAIAAYGSWELAAKAAGLDPEEIPLPGVWTKNKIIVAVQAVYNNGHAVNTAAMQKVEKPEILEILGNIVGDPNVPPTNFHSAAVRKFGSWDDALRAAGLDIWEIKLSMARRGNLSTLASQEEVATNLDGTGGIKRYLGRPEAPPEVVAEKTEMQSALREAVKGLDSENDREIAELILETLVETDGVPSPDELAASLSQEIGREITSDDISRVFGKLALSGILQSFRRDIEQDEY